MIPGLAVLGHISEQQIYRPQDDETQKNTIRARPSCTPRRHSTPTYDCTILQTSTAVEGSRHDFAVFKESPHISQGPSRRAVDGARRAVPKAPRVLGRQRLHENEDSIPADIPRVQKMEVRKEADDCRIIVRHGFRKDANPRLTHDTPGQGVLDDERYVLQHAKKKYAGYTVWIGRHDTIRRTGRGLAARQGSYSARMVRLFSNCGSCLVYKKLHDFVITEFNRRLLFVFIF